MIWLDSAIPFDRVPSALLRARPRSPVTRARGNYVTSFASWLSPLGATSPKRLPPPMRTGDQVELGADRAVDQTAALPCPSHAIKRKGLLAELCTRADGVRLRVVRPGFSRCYFRLVLLRSRFRSSPTVCRSWRLLSSVRFRGGKLLPRRGRLAGSTVL